MNRAHTHTSHTHIERDKHAALTALSQIWHKENTQTQYSIELEIKHRPTINTAARDHVFKPKDTKKGEGKTAKVEFSREGIPKVASHYSHFFFLLQLSDFTTSEARAPLSCPHKTRLGHLINQLENEY